MNDHALLFPLLSVPLLVGCAAGGQLASRGDASAGDDAGDDAAFFPAGDDDASTSTTAGGDDASVPPPGDEGPPITGTGDAGPLAPPFDAGPGGPCTQPPAPGDLRIDELMIESVAGTGDYGEWLEVRSQRPCAIDLRGLHGECADGAKVRTFDVTDDVWIAAGGSFVVADSVDPTINHDLPGTLIVWAGQPGDVLRNKGGTVTLLRGTTIVDSVTFPALKLTVGASVAFPADCPLARRSDWTAWQTSVASWFPGFFGTPNAPNTDVHCP